MKTPSAWNHAIYRAKSYLRIFHKQRLLMLAVLAGVSVLLGTAPAAGNVKLPALIGDNMVLQQGWQVTIWGAADAGEEVTVSFGEEKQTAIADSSGGWKVGLRPLKAAGPREMTISGKNTVTIHNALVGEVWLCSGQSNMEFALEGRPGVLGGVKNAEQELAAADYPQLRLFRVEKAVAGKPQSEVHGQWVVTSPLTVEHFSAVGYFFGRDLYRALKVPVGLIDASRGGTPAEAWMRAEVLEADPDLKVMADSWRQRISDFPQALEVYKQRLSDWEKSAEVAEASGRVVPPMPAAPQDPRSHRWRDAGLWNGMIAPLTSYTIAGNIWYQGESNTDSPYQYRKVFAELIQDWRRVWGEGDFPFLFVQLASFATDGASSDSWAVLRESQEKALALPKTGMAVAIDIGDSHDIHPKNKQEVGRRLALVAEGIAYGRKVEYMGPAFKSLRMGKGTLHLQFGHLGGGLVARGGPLTGFQMAGKDQKFFPASARIAGNEVVLSSPRVPEPVAARYAWANDPKCNLYNQAGLPAPPFRTDDWPVTSQGEIRKEAPQMW
jgi:sialate O-acetylesterase